MTFHVIYTNAIKRIKEAGDKINERDFRVSRARIEAIYEAPVNGRNKKKTEEATKKNPYAHLVNINSGKTHILPLYAVIRHMNEPEVDEYENLSASTSSKSSSSNGKKRSSDDSDSEPAPPAKKKNSSK